MNKWYKVLNQTDTEAEFLIYEEIGWMGVEAREFVKELKTAGAKNITVRINSPGGDMFGGIAIYNYLRAMESNGSRVKTIVDGVAASAASIIFLAGSEGMREMATGSSVMIHDPSWAVWGNADEFEKAAQTLRQFGDLILDIYEERTKLTRDEAQKLMSEETWLNSVEALAKGFATNVSSREAVAACAGIRRKGFAAPAGMEIMALDNSQKPNDSQNSEPDPPRKELTMLKELKAHFTGKPELFAIAADIVADNDKLTQEEVIAQVEATAKDNRLTALEADKAELEKTVAELKQKVADAQAKQQEGAPPVDSGKPPEGDSSPENVLDEYRAIEDKEDRLEFFRKNKAAIMRLESKERLKS